MTKKAKLKPEEREEQIGLLGPGPTVASIEDSDVLASLSALARAFGTDRETLRRCLLEHEAGDPVAIRGGAKLYALRTVYQAWTDASEETDPDKLSPFKRRAWYQGEREKLAVQSARGELVDAIDMERTLGRVMQTLVRGLESLLDVVERDSGLTPAQALAAEEHIDGVRDELYKQLIADSGEEDQPVVSDTEVEPELATKVSRGSRPRKAPVASGAVAVAESFLLDHLGAGAKSAAAVLKVAKKSGMSESTIRRARKALGDRVVARREGRGWVWELT